MTHEQFIELSTAKLAKQTGFDWNVGAYYLNGYFYRANFYANYNLRILADYKTISAPTQSVLQRWLREVKGMYISMNYWYIHNEWRCQVKSQDNSILLNYIERTYEAALEAGLQKCLTILIEKR